MKTLKLIVVAALAFSLASCCACRKSKSNVPLLGTEWKLSQLNGANISSDKYTVMFHAEGRVSGVGDCNRFAGTFTRGAGSNSTSGSLSMGSDLVSTRMMCLNQEQEDKFLGMFRTIDSYNIDGDRLMLIKGGDVLAIFDRVVVEAAPEAPEK